MPEESIQGHLSEGIIIRQIDFDDAHWGNQSWLPLKFVKLSLEAGQPHHRQNLEKSKERVLLAEGRRALANDLVGTQRRYVLNPLNAMTASS